MRWAFGAHYSAYDNETPATTLRRAPRPAPSDPPACPIPRAFMAAIGQGVICAMTRHRLSYAPIEHGGRTEAARSAEGGGASVTADELERPPAHLQVTRCRRGLDSRLEANFGVHDALFLEIEDLSGAGGAGQGCTG